MSRISTALFAGLCSLFSVMPISFADDGFSLKENINKLYGRTTSCDPSVEIVVKSYVSNIKGTKKVSSKSEEIAKFLRDVGCNVTGPVMPDNKKYKKPDTVNYFYKEDKDTAELVKNIISEGFNIEFRNESFYPQYEKDYSAGYIEIWVK